MKVEAYLFFDGRAEEALEFYEKALGAEIEAVMRFKDAPDRPPPDQIPPGSDDKIMHSSFCIGETRIMASDGMCGGSPVFQGASLALQPDSAEEAERLFHALADHGEIQMPLGPTFFSSRFGIVKDRFGVSWMLVAPPPA